MENAKLYEAGLSIYPGNYVPLHDEEIIREELKKHNVDIIHPPVNVTELTDSFKIEVAIPGVEREELLIYAIKNVLSVCAVHKEYLKNHSESIQMHEFNHEYFDRYITLPENADAEFVSAEYRGGILRLYIPKAKHPAKNLHTRIIVY